LRALAEQAQPDAFAREAAWQAGRALTLEQALVDAHALASLA
jgi:hypothetical protein